MHDIGEHQGHPFIVMEYLEGQTLKQKILGRRLPTEFLIDLGIEVADAFDAAHGKGIVHRDIQDSRLRSHENLPTSTASSTIQTAWQKHAGRDLQVFIPLLSA